MGVAGIVLGGVLDKELRDFEATAGSASRDRAASRGDFAVVVVEGYGKVGIDAALFDWFREHDGRMASLFGRCGAPLRLRRRSAADAPRPAAARAIGSSALPTAVRRGRGRAACASSTACTRRRVGVAARSAIVRFDDGRTRGRPARQSRPRSSAGTPEPAPAGSYILSGMDRTTARAGARRRFAATARDGDARDRPRARARGAAGHVPRADRRARRGQDAAGQGRRRGARASPSVVNSPTFVLMNEHVGRLRLYHVDAYRLDDPEEAVDAGLLDDRQCRWGGRRRVGRSARGLAPGRSARDTSSRRRRRRPSARTLRWTRDRRARTRTWPTPRCESR